MTWEPGNGYGRLSGVSDRLMDKFEVDQDRGWKEWFADHYPGFGIDFRLQGVRPEGAEPYIFWTWFVKNRETGREVALLHGESAEIFPGKDRRFPHSGIDILLHLEVWMDGGPGGELLEQDLAEEFGVDPR